MCFYGCSSLGSMAVAKENPIYDSREDCNAIIETATNALIATCKESRLPNTITALGIGCFGGRGDLTTFTVPESVTSLGDDCFSGCTSLTFITIPESVTSLGSYCFIGCSSLTSVTIPNSVTSLGSYCFDSCRSLTSITMLPTTPPDVSYSSIFLNTPLETVYVESEEAKALYQTKAPWEDYEIVVMGTGVDDLQVEGNTPRIAGYYDLNGKSTSGKQRGPVIVRYSDGSTRKVMRRAL